MEEIFKQYGGPIITVIVIVALIAIMTILLAGDGVVHDMFSDLITKFFEKSGLDGGTTWIPYIK